MTRLMQRRRIAYEPNANAIRDSQAEHGAAEEEQNAAIEEIARLALAMTRALRLADAEDIAQEVALECLERMRAGTWAPGSIRLRVIVRKLVWVRAIDHLREAVRRRYREAAYGAAVVNPSDAWRRPDLALDERYLLGLHETALARLPRLCRRAYVLVRERGYSHLEAARVLKVTRATVGQHVVRAQREIRRTLAAHGIDAPAPRKNGRRLLVGEQVGVGRPVNAKGRQRGSDVELRGRHEREEPPIE